MKLRTIVQNMVLLVMSCGFSLVMLEGGIRVYQYGFDSLSPRIMDSIHNIGTSGLIQASDNQEILYELRPDIDTLFKKTEISTNNQGLRDSDYTMQKSGDAFRIAVLGDSMTMPVGVPLEDAYHSILEKRFAREYQNEKIEFINFGVGGYNLRQYAAVLEHKALLYDPDLIVIGFCMDNDWDEEEEYLEHLASGKPYHVKSSSRPFFEWHFVAVAKDLFKNMQRTIWQKSSARNSNSDGRLDPDKRVYMDAMFGRIREIAKLKDIEVVVVSLDTEPAEPDFLAFLQDLAEKHEFRFLDTTQAFRNTTETQFCLYKADCHPNATANQIYADQIYPFLKNLLDQRTIKFEVRPGRILQAI